MKPLVMILQCGAFIIIPMATFGMGLKKVFQFSKSYRVLGLSGLLAIVFFEAAIIGLLVDPRSKSHSIVELLLTSAAVGFLTFLFILILTSLFNLLFRLSRK